MSRELPPDAWRTVASFLVKDICCIYTPRDCAADLRAITSAVGVPLEDFLSPSAFLSNSVSKAASSAYLASLGLHKGSTMTQEEARREVRKRHDGDCKTWYVDTMLARMNITTGHVIARRICSEIVNRKWAWIAGMHKAVFSKWNALFDKEQTDKVRYLSMRVWEDVVDVFNVDIRWLLDNFVLNSACTIPALEFALSKDPLSQRKMLKNLLKNTDDVLVDASPSCILDTNVWHRAVKISTCLVVPEKIPREVLDNIREYLTIGEDAWEMLKMSVDDAWIRTMLHSRIPRAMHWFMLHEHIPTLPACIRSLQILMSHQLWPSLYVCGLGMVFVMGLQYFPEDTSTCDLPSSWTIKTKWGNAMDLSCITHSMATKVVSVLKAYKRLSDALVQRGCVDGIRSSSCTCRKYVMTGGKGGVVELNRVVDTMEAFGFLHKHTMYGMWVKALGKKKRFVCMSLAIHECTFRNLPLPDGLARVWKAFHRRYARYKNVPSCMNSRWRNSKSSLHP